MAQKSILNTLKRYGLNPNEWFIQSLRCDGWIKTIHFRSQEGWTLRGSLQEWGSHFHLKDLELVDF